jgi:predicted enzyme related to lactoylglutathione lyase
MRLQLALNVQDLSASIDYYGKLFAVDVTKVKPGYANFEVAEPPLKLVLFGTANAGIV